LLIIIEEKKKKKMNEENKKKCNEAMYAFRKENIHIPEGLGKPLNAKEISTEELIRFGNQKALWSEKHQTFYLPKLSEENIGCDIISKEEENGKH